MSGATFIYVYPGSHYPEMGQVELEKEASSFGSIKGHEK